MIILIIGAICNDGSVASYYVEQADYTPGQTIMVYLEVCDTHCIIYLYDDNYDDDDHSDVNDSDMKDDAHCNGLGYVEQADYTPGQTILR